MLLNVKPALNREDAPNSGSTLRAVFSYCTEPTAPNTENPHTAIGAKGADIPYCSRALSYGRHGVQY